MTRNFKIKLPSSAATISLLILVAIRLAGCHLAPSRPAADHQLTTTTDGRQHADQANQNNNFQSLHKALEDEEELEASSSQTFNESGQLNHSTQIVDLPHRQPENQTNDDRNSSASSPSPSSSSSASSSASIKRMLVSQLSDLIMNNEPEQIANQMRGTKISGQILSETKNDQDFLISANDLDSDDNDDDDAEEEFLDDDDDDVYERDLFPLGEMARPDRLAANLSKMNNKTQLQDSTGSKPAKRQKFKSKQSRVVKSQLPVAQALELTQQQDDSLVLDDQQQQQQQQQQQTTGNQADEQTVTCSPDYEDQSMLEAASGGNLTAEQQQQLLSGADSAGLLVANSNESLQHRQFAQQVGACVQPGSQMIETITKVITPILFSVIIVVGLLGNIIVMLVILEDRKTERELTPTNLLILDLSLADLSFILFCIPFTGWDYAVGHWVFGPLWCQFNQYLIVVCALSSIYTLVLMSIDRFMAIVYPIECISYRTSQNMLKAIYIKWIVILLIALPTWTMHGLIDSPLGPDQYNCRFLADQYNPLHFQIIFFITSYLFPLILIFCLYLTLLNKLWFGSKPHGHKESLKMLESKKKVTWLVAGIVVVFALCWCPIQVMLILMRLKSHKITATYVAIQVFAHTLGYMNSCINPIVYAFASETFHQSFKRSWLGRFINWFFCCSSLEQANGPSSAFIHNNSNVFSRRHSTMTAASHHHHPQHNSQANDRFLNTNQLGPSQQISSGGGGTTNGFDSIEDGRGDKSPRVRSLNNIFSPSMNGNNNNNKPQRQDHNRKGPLDPVDGSNSTFTLIATPEHQARLDKQQLQNGSQTINNNNSSSDGNSFNLNSRQPLPLEPRDRPTMIGNNNSYAQTRQQQQTTPMDYAGDYAPEDQSIKLERITTIGKANQSTTLIPRQPTATESVFSCPTSRTTTTTTSESSVASSANKTKVPAKQQLVARMVNQSNGNNQISHQFEPFEDEHDEHNHHHHQDDGRIQQHAD